MPVPIILRVLLEQKSAVLCLQSFSSASRRACACKKYEHWGAGTVVCPEWGVKDLHVVQLVPLPLPPHLSISSLKFIMV